MFVMLKIFCFCIAFCLAIQMEIVWSQLFVCTDVQTIHFIFFLINLIKVLIINTAVGDHIPY